MRRLSMSDLTIVQWLAKNPNATQEQKDQAFAQLDNLTPQEALREAQKLRYIRAS